MLSEQVLRLDTLNLLSMGQDNINTKGSFLDFPYDDVRDDFEDDDLDEKFYRVYGGEG